MQMPPNNLLNSFIDKHNEKRNALANLAATRINSPKAIATTSSDTDLQKTKSVKEQYYSYSSEQSNALSLQLKTRDGDVLSINLSTLEAYSREKHSRSAETENSFHGQTVDSFSHYQATDFSLALNGDLDDDEKIAITHMLDQLTNVADKFFKGDLEKTLQGLSDMEYDSREIAGFSFAMSQSESVQVTRAYREVAEYQEVPKEDQPLAPKDISEIVNELANSLKHVSELLENARGQMKDLLAQALDAHPANPGTIKPATQDTLLEMFLDSAEALNELQEQATAQAKPISAESDAADTQEHLLQ